MEIKIITDAISKKELLNIAENHMTAENWQKLSLLEQMGNIGSEISRAVNWRGKSRESYENATDRALDLLDLTIADKRWQTRLKEIVRVREFLVDAIFGGKEYNSTFEDLNRYFFYFALAARINR